MHSRTRTHTRTHTHTKLLSNGGKPQVQNPLSFAVSRIRWATCKLIFGYRSYFPYTTDTAQEYTVLKLSEFFPSLWKQALTIPAKSFNIANCPRKDIFKDLFNHIRARNGVKIKIPGWAATLENIPTDMRPRKTQISQRICAVWSESSMSAWRNFASLAIQNAASEDSDQTARMQSDQAFLCPSIYLIFLSVTVHCNPRFYERLACWVKKKTTTKNPQMIFWNSFHILFRK